jgi:hypothetical protein
MSVNVVMILELSGSAYKGLRYRFLVHVHPVVRQSIPVSLKYQLHSDKESLHFL